MTNPADDLTTIYRLLDEGRHPAWPKNEYGKPLVQYGTVLGESYWEYRFGSGPSGAYPIPLKGLYAIVRDSLEGWLVKEGWNLHEPGYEHQREYENEPQGTGYLSLTEALTYALENTKEK